MAGHKITIVTSFPHYRKGSDKEWDSYRGKMYEITKWDDVDVIRTYVYAPIFKESKKSLIYRALNFITFNFSSLIGALFLVKNVDIVFAPSSPPLTNGLISYIVSAIKRCPLVYNVQDMYPDMAVKLGLIHNKNILNFLYFIEKLVYSISSKVLTISKGMSEQIEQKGVPKKKIEIIENFIDTDFIKPFSKRNPFSTTYGLDDKFVVMYAGNIGIPHGVEVVIYAAEILRQEEDILFCFLARGEAKNQIEQMAKEKKLTNVKFIPQQPQEVVPLIWASASVGLVTYRSGCADFSVPSKLLAMMCAAKPVIASVDNDSETAKIIMDTGCGICVTPEAPDEFSSVILRLKSDPQLADAMGQAGRTYIENNLQRRFVSKKYEMLFNSIINKNS
jgi:colanic acid biosynthesis glycosyl transferase WcaI